jgi:hypothetical protein
MRIHHLTLAASLAAFSVLCLVAQDAQKPPATAGPTTDGFLLPNGWKLCPAGEHLVLSDLPLNIVLLPGGKEALASQDVYQSWFGLAVSPDARRVWWAGGAGIVHE